MLLQERFGADLNIVASPLLAPSFLDPEIPHRPYSALIFTSETGVQALQRISANPALASIRKAWCVGDRTAQAATDAGLIARSAKGDVKALEAAVLAAHQAGPLLYLHGQEQRGNLAHDLNLAGLETVSVIVYSQEPKPLNQSAVDLLCTQSTVILPLFSPRTASLFVEEWQKLQPTVRLIVVALSDAVAKVAGSLPYYKMAVAHHPNAAAMLKAIADVIATVSDA